MFNNNKNTKKNSKNMKNSFHELDTSPFNVDTEGNFKNSSSKFYDKFNIAYLGLGVLVTFILGGYSFSSYNNKVQNWNQAYIYSIELGKKNKDIQNNLNELQNLNISNFNELIKDIDTINSIQNILKNGGNLNSYDYKIEAIKNNDYLNQIHEQINRLQTLNLELKKDKNSILSIEKNYNNLFSNILTLKKDLISLKKLTINESEEFNLQINNLIYILERIENNMNKIVQNYNFSFEIGYLIEKDLKTIPYIFSSLKFGNKNINLKSTDNNTILESLGQIEQNNSYIMKINEEFYKNLENFIFTKIYLNNTKKSLEKLNEYIQDFNNYIINNQKQTTNVKLISFLLFITSLLMLFFLSYLIYQKYIDNSKLSSLIEKNQNNENAIMLTLMQLSSLESKDFTSQIYIDDKNLKPIGDKIEKIRQGVILLIKQLRKNTEHVFENVSDTDKIINKLNSITDLKTSKIIDAIHLINKITQEIDELAQITWIAGEETKNSQQASLEGKTLVKESINKMDEIRDTIQESSKKIKKLGESAQSITEVTNIIQDITKQINVLALNAAIQAASSGESGREFSVVAQEVQRLALDSENATKKIGEIILEIQNDTAVAISSMEKTTQEVVVGSELTEKAGLALQKIENLANSVVDNVSSAANKLEDKSIEMANFALEMKKLQDINNDNTEVIKQTTNQTENIKLIADKLDLLSNEFKIKD